ncbi:hypothetical protein PVK06_048715 [Gossypium arboreum]|uniref:Uncharacterized protein n=1 Tax=Gossypium arboreum TaxID=29729 RepID=A0ABR0MGP7_GOSAR|nr:hypothetical protein PVK06_048715 [Gossypium arboreum]
MHNSRDFLCYMGSYSNQGFVATNVGMLSIINVGPKDGMGPSDPGDTITGLMDLESNGESSPTHIDDVKKHQGTLVSISVILGDSIVSHGQHDLSLALLGTTVGHYENFQLERSWTGKSTGNSPS